MKTKRNFSLSWLSSCAAALLGIAGLLITAIPAAKAQSYLDTISVTNTVPATSTNAAPVSAAIDVSGYDEFSLLVTGKLTGAGTSAVSYTIGASVDGTNYITNFVLPLTAAGTGTVAAHTNVQAQAFRFFKVTSIGNANANAWTNGVVMVGTKKALMRYRPY